MAAAAAAGFPASRLNRPWLYTHEIDFRKAFPGVETKQQLRMYIRHIRVHIERGLVAAASAESLKRAKLLRDAQCRPRFAAPSRQRFSMKGYCFVCVCVCYRTGCVDRYI